MPVTKISYDELPYTSNAMPYAQPDRLATVAMFFGMTPPPVETSRVLELGCGDGRNLIASAYTLPQSECLGIDLSPPRIARGKATIDAVGLTNIQLQCQNILDLDDSIGQFDYIIAHGIYSWVPVAVQNKILNLCQQHLVPNGVAYVSYNTKPGWNMRSTLRDLMLYHTATISDPEQREVQLKALLTFLLESTAASNDAYSQHIAEEIKNFSGLPSTFVFHEFLEEENKPVYFHQFTERAKVFGLTYLGDAYLHTMLAGNFPSTVAEKLQAFNRNVIHQEQVMDFLSNRHFRHTLLCHQGTSLRRAISADVISQFYIASSLQPITDNSFQNQRGTLNTESPVIQAAFRYLAGRWPAAFTFAEIVEEACQQIGQAPAQTDEYAIANALLIAYTKGLIELYTSPLRLVTTVSPRPLASQLARWEVQQRKRVTNLRCEEVIIEDITALQILPYLDGNHDREALLDLFQGWIKAGKLAIEVEQSNEAVKLAEVNMRNVLGQVLEDSLQLLARGGVLRA